MIKFASALLLLMAAALIWSVYEVNTLREELSIANTRLTISQASNQSLLLQIRSASHAQQQLQNTLAGQRVTASAQQQKIEELINDNKQLRDWADRPLPAGLNWLQRPAITGADHYRQHLSDRQPLPVNPGQPQH